MKIFKTFLLLSAIFVLGACRTVRQVSQTKETQKEINTVKKTTYKDTVFYTEKTTASLKIPVKSLEFSGSGLNGFETAFKSNLKPVIYEQKNGNAKVKVVRDSLFFYAYAECDSLSLKAKIRNEFESEKIRESSIQDREEKEKQRNNYWMWGSLIVIAFIAGFVTSKIY